MLKRSILPVVVALVASTGCSGSEPGGPAADSVFAENRGTPIETLDIPISANLRWEDPVEIAYNTFATVGGTAHIRTYRVGNGVRRTIDGPRGTGVFYASLMQSPDGTQTYFSLSGSNAPIYHAVPGAEPVQLAARSSFSGSAKYSAFGGVVLPSPDSRRAAYIAAPDSVRLYDSQTRTSRHVANGCRALVAFSPDGQQVLCRANAAFFLVTISDGSMQPYALPGGRTTDNLHSVRWGDAGLQFVYSGASFVTEIVTAPSGTATKIVTAGLLRSLEFPDHENLTWSRDGRKVALSTSFCSDLRCPVPQFTIYVIDLATQRAQRVAVVNIPTTGGNEMGINHLAFSPDGTRIAYISGVLGQASISISLVP